MKNNSKHYNFDNWAFLISVLTGPLTLVTACIIALIASSSFVVEEDRSRDLMNFATVLFGGGAAVTGTTQPRKPKSENTVEIENVRDINVEDKPNTQSSN